VVGAPLIRDSDGLALSSRNAYLTAEERRRALSLCRALGAMVTALSSGIVQAQSLLAIGRDSLQAEPLDYLAIVDPDSLAAISTVDGPARALVAGYFGQTRLIDNIALVP
jgi:pantoate--beta-alanine ligase